MKFFRSSSAFRRRECHQGEDEPCRRCDSCRILDRALIDEGKPDLATLVGQKLYEQESLCVAPVS